MEMCQLEEKEGEGVRRGDVIVRREKGRGSKGNGEESERKGGGKQGAERRQ